MCRLADFLHKYFVPDAVLGQETEHKGPGPAFVGGWEVKGTEFPPLLSQYTAGASKWHPKEVGTVDLEGLLGDLQSALLSNEDS